jgi:tetraacyldisaccharide 4'-kinase
VSLRARLERRWYSTEPPPSLLLPLSRLYSAVVERRRRQQEAVRGRLPVPVIVVGNISVGGTGKTPFVIWLVERLRQGGWRPGVISRGYGGSAARYPLRVDAQTDPAQAGDEPCLIARRCACPVVVAPDRLAAARMLISEGTVDVLVSDDGLQHYRLPRQLEICVVDGQRGLGNGALLPAGPLREPAQRLNEVALVVANGGGFIAPRTPTVSMHLRSQQVVALKGGVRKSLSSFQGRNVHAVAGIGHPERFFSMLEAQGVHVRRHAFPDHYAFRADDLRLGDDDPVLMTEKDAIKCRGFGDDRLYAVPVDAQLSPADEDLVQQCLDTLHRLR